LKILLIGDVHLTNPNNHPSSCTSSYTDDLFGLLYQASDLAKELGATAIVQAGDFFHIKAPGRNSHQLIQRAMQWLSDCSVPVAIVPGNHDLLNDRLASLDEGQPLGVLFSSGLAIKADGYILIPKDDITGADPYIPVFGLPWQQLWDAEQSVADQAVKAALKSYEPKDTPQLIVTHAPFFPLGENPAYEHFSVEQFANYLGNRGSVYYGHIHDPHGEYVVNGVRFCNNGALSRGSLTESNLSRKVGVTSWDSITGAFEFHELNARPATEVFRVKEVTELKQQQLTLDAFLNSVGRSSIEMTSIEAVMDKIRSMQLGKDLENIIEELLTSVE